MTIFECTLIGLVIGIVIGMTMNYYELKKLRKKREEGKQK